jgi:two-component system phosphate regulon sensor histidine kinase PhoR
VIFLEDETELRRSESIRRDFVANVSHELRTPLASLKALVETLEEGALEDPPAAREFLRLMHVEVDSLTQLVFELLELSQIESGQAEMEKRPVVPISLLEAAYRRLRTQATRAGVDLRMAAEHGLPMISADPVRVGQVLLNLLQNAIKFTPEGGVVTLTAARDGNGIRFGVTDTGIGISREDLSRLFERFFKVDRSRASGGTGLGLAIAKHLVQAHGGVIGAFSLGEGHGSTVWFVLPTNGESVAPVSQQASLASQTRGALPSSDAPDGIPSSAVPGVPATPDTP